VIKLLLRKQLGPAIASDIKASLKNIGKHCTETEIAADQAERESLKIKQLEFLRERVGGIYDGIVSGVVRTGIFVELQGTMVEGFVSFASITDDYFALDEGKYQAVGKRSGRKFKLGDKIRIIVARVDLDSRRADFAIADNNNGNSKKPHKRRKKRK
jgi:ribonuclease R